MPVDPTKKNVLLRPLIVLFIIGACLVADASAQCSEWNCAVRRAPVRSAIVGAPVLAATPVRNQLVRGGNRREARREARRARWER